MNALQAVTFDVGGTLIEPWPSVGHVYLAVAERFGISGVTTEAINRNFHEAWKSRRSFDYTRGAWHALVRETFAGLWPEPLAVECFNAIYDRFGEARSWRVHEDVQPALHALRARQLKLGLISNWDERLRPLLAALDLDRWFEVIVISHEVRHQKPDRQIFKRAAELLAVPPDRIVHVGDSSSEDVAGAEAAGLRALLVRGEDGTGLASLWAPGA